MRYTKPALSFADQVTLLESRKLVITDRRAAEHALSHISYYRLSAYFRPFRAAGTEEFTGASFDDILALYRFDKALRRVVNDHIEAIEVHLRTRLTYHLAMQGGAFAYTQAGFFDLTLDHNQFLNDIKDLENRSSDKFVEHYHSRYGEEPHLPIWMATELMSLGFISRLFVHVHVDIKKTDRERFRRSSWRIGKLASHDYLCPQHMRSSRTLVESRISNRAPDSLQEWALAIPGDGRKALLCDPCSDLRHHEPNHTL